MTTPGQNRPEPPSFLTLPDIYVEWHWAGDGERPVRGFLRDDITKLPIRDLTPVEVSQAHAYLDALAELTGGQKA